MASPGTSDNPVVYEDNMLGQCSVLNGMRSEVVVVWEVVPGHRVSGSCPFEDAASGKTHSAALPQRAQSLSVIKLELT